MIRHAGLVATRLDGVWKGALIEGPSGSGKSDLALRAIEEGFRLVADDRVELWASGGGLYGRAPAPLLGLVEARGLGLLALEPLPLSQVALIVRAGAAERLPEPETAEVLGVSLPLLTLSFREASAPAKLSRALAMFDAHVNRRM